MKYELAQRYIYAVTKKLPQKMREEVKQELEELISEMLEARCGEVLPADKDLRVVLTELGDPGELAAKYGGQDGRALISGAYFLHYKYWLKLMLPIAAGIFALAGLLNPQYDSAIFTGGGCDYACYDGCVCVWWPFWAIFLTQVAFGVGRAIIGAFTGMLQAFGITTLVFAILEWRKVKLGSDDLLSNLPELPQENNGAIKRYESIIGMIWQAVIAGALLGVPWIFGFWFSELGWVPYFHPERMRAMWLPIALWSLLGIAKYTMQLCEKRYTIRLAAVSTGLNAGIAFLVMFVFIVGVPLNDVFDQHVFQLLSEHSDWIQDVATHGYIWIPLIVGIVLGVETITTWVKALRK